MGSIRSFLADWSSARRFSALPPEQRAIVFYAEDGDSWPHFEPIVRELTGTLGRTICNVTSSPRDPVLQSRNPRILTFCIGEGTIRTSWFMSLQAGVCVMTMPDLETFHLKRSRRAEVHYAYVFHSMVSAHMIYRKQAFDHFDSVLCVGPHHIREIRAIEKMYGLPPKQLIAHGYGRLDTLMQNDKQDDTLSDLTQVLVAPSWGPDGLLETCGADLVRTLLAAGFRVIVRPHPMTRRKWPACVRRIENEFRNHPRLTVESGVASYVSLAAADIMISDWSGAALEYAFAYERPVLFVDMPRKVNNPEYERIDCEPLEVSIRERIGRVLSPDQLAESSQVVREMCEQSAQWRETICQAREQCVYNLGHSGRIAAEAIVALADGKTISSKEGR